MRIYTGETVNRRKSKSLTTVKMITLLIFSLMFLSLNPVEAFSFSEFFEIGGSRTSTNSLSLLAVKETPAGYQGSLAEVTLEQRPGSGRVFIDTYPLSQIDTQISTRFSKDIACKYIDADCGSSDFVFTIRSESGIIGGPSAGAAMSVLMIASLEGVSIRDDVAITGTINSGGVIGPVSGIKPKIDVAAQNGFSKVLIPMGSIVEDFDNDVTYSPEEYGEMVGIDVVEVSEIDDAVYEFTGQRFIDQDRDIDIPQLYVDTMSSVSDNLCDRSQDLFDSVRDIPEDISEEDANLAERLKQAGMDAMDRAESTGAMGNHYSASSHCYNANINFKNLELLYEALEDDPLSDRIEGVASDIYDFEDEIESLEFETLSDFEVYMIMKERVEDAKSFINDARDHFESARSDDGDYRETYNHLSLAIERLYTSKIWMDFLGMGGRRFDIDDEVLSNACSQKISEAQEQAQYIDTFVPSASLAEIKSDIENAIVDRENDENALCISRASRAKASANVMMTAMSTTQDAIGDLVEGKLGAARNVIVREQDRDIFPIMGYSYYEYANSLMENDPQSALLYAEYALEMSWLDIYFDQSVDVPRIRINLDHLLLVAIGFILGTILMIAALPRDSRHLRHRRLKRRIRRRLKSLK